MVRKGTDRHHDRRRKQEVWHTFTPGDRPGPVVDGFGALEILDEDRLPPGVGVPRHLHRDAEIITYVREGGLAHEDSLGRSGVIRAGEFQRVTTGHGIRHSETNASRTDWAHVFQLQFRPAYLGLDPSQEQKRFCAAERRGILCVVASPDGRKGSLRIHQNVLIYSTLLHRGQHVVHEFELAEERRAWLHIVQGEVLVGDVLLTTGDGLSVTAERAVSITAHEECEILLLDLGPAAT